MPRYAASRVLPATVEDVWAVLEEAERFPAWWPGVDRVEPSVRRAVAPGALWKVEGRNQLSLLRRSPQLTGTLLVFKTFDRISYGLIVGASSEIHVADYVRNP